jgi:hypothetical protein
VIEFDVAGEIAPVYAILKMQEIAGLPTLTEKRWNSCLKAALV